MVSPYDPAGPHLTRHQVSELDRRAALEFELPVEVLMERAGGAVAEAVEHCFPEQGEVLIIHGKGNNGGDGLVAARILREHSRTVRTVRGDAFTELQTEPDVIVDALFGTGLTRAVEGEPRRWIDWMNQRSERVVSVDLPSGLDADTGAALGVAVRAFLTVTMGLPKKGFLNPDSRAFTGTIVVADLGFPPALMSGILRAPKSDF